MDINRASPVPPSSPTSLGLGSSGGSFGVGATASPSEFSAYPGMEGVLVMEIEPAAFGRFRYEAEGRQNNIEGCEADSFPTVAVSPEWAPYVPEGSVVRVSLVRRHDFRSHHHILASKDNSNTDQALQGGRAVFPNLVVKRQKSSTRYPPEDQRAVRLLFTLPIVRDGVQTEAFCVSRPIFNSDLKICHLSHHSGPADQYTEVVILCSKVVYVERWV